LLFGESNHAHIMLLTAAAESWQRDRNSSEIGTLFGESCGCHRGRTCGGSSSTGRPAGRAFPMIGFRSGITFMNTARPFPMDANKSI